MTYDLAIIGGGPAGVSAGVYASRKKLRTVIFAENFGGQSLDSADIQNWIGTISISGLDLARSFENHLRAYAADIVDIKLGEYVVKVSGNDGNFLVETKSGETYSAKTVLISVGSTRRKLTVKGASELENRGITYCASCDGPLFAGQDVAVIGGGNAGFESAAQLSAYSKSVTIIHKNSEFKADPVTVEKVLSKPNVKGILDAELVSIDGTNAVEGLTYKDKNSGDEVKVPLTGVFVEIGLIPQTDLVKGFLNLNQNGQIEIDPWTGSTSIKGVWAAGDCTNVKYHQNNIASGDGVRALEDIYLHLHAK